MKNNAKKNVRLTPLQLCRALALPLAMFLTNNSTLQLTQPCTRATDVLIACILPFGIFKLQELVARFYHWYNGDESNP